MLATLNYSILFDIDDDIIIIVMELQLAGN